jgi:hypothetical protein
MASRRKQQSHEPINYDDPLELDDIYEPAPLPPAREITGLSDEEDARVLMDRRFNKRLLFCINCEVHYESRYEVDPAEWITHAPDCPRCHMMLEPAGTTPLPTRRKHTT